MARKINHTIPKELKEKIRTLYITTDISLKEVADKFGISENSVYTWSKKEGWTFLKQAYNEKNMMEIADKEIEFIIDSIKFWESIQEYCKKRLKTDKDGNTVKKYYKGESYLVDVNLEPAEVKCIVDSYKEAEERIILLKSVKLRGNEEDVKE